jgi:hypothetical protein
MSHPLAARGGPAGAGDRPLVVLYLYVHAPGEHFVYPNTRASNSAARLALRYLECAVTQAATLRVQDAPCDIVLASNGIERIDLGAHGRRLVGALRSLDVELIETGYDHRPPGDDPAYPASRYVFDAILATCGGQPPARPIWLTDLDCVWRDAAAMFAAAPAPPALGCLFIDYPPDWNTVGSERYGSRDEIGALAAAVGGGAVELPPWIGGELLAGSAASLLELVARAESADAELASEEIELATEEQLLTLLAARGQARFEDLSRLGRRLQTGWRHEAQPVADARDLAFWHLPAEKGLSLRRTAAEAARGDLRHLRADIASAERAARRFRVGSPSRPRIVRDSVRIVAQRARERVPARRARRRAPARGPV